MPVSLGHAGPRGALSSGVIFNALVIIILNIIMLWNSEGEETFFRTLLTITNYQNLFYKVGERYLAYYPKRYKGRAETLQARNSLIGNYTEKFVADLLQKTVNELGLYAVQDVVCQELTLPSNSSADVAICTTPDKKQQVENIKAIFEVKMSIVNNWEYHPQTESITKTGDHTTHKGNPSLLRSDSMLKAIGKTLNIRVSHPLARKMPIVVIGSTPVTTHYVSKTTQLIKLGFVQGFWCLNEEFNRVQANGYTQIQDEEVLKLKVKNLLETKFQFFSSMIPKAELGRMIEIANQEKEYQLKAEKFLELLNH